jgi:hypothetical protein
MIKFKKPTNLNGTELLAELAAVGIVLIPIQQSPVVDSNNDMWLDIKPADQAKAAEVVAAHNGTTVAPEPTVQEKLASVGLSVDDLKQALGL